MKITKSELQKIIKEEIKRKKVKESARRENGILEDAKAFMNESPLENLLISSSESLKVKDK